MESYLDTFFEIQRRERESELRYLNQSSSAVQLASENYHISQMLSRRMRTRKPDAREWPDEDHASVHVNPETAEQLHPGIETELQSSYDQFFETQRSQRLAEVALMSNQNLNLQQRSSALSRLFAQRLGSIISEQSEEDEDTLPVASELEEIEQSRRVSTLLTNTFRSRLESALASGLPSVRHNYPVARARVRAQTQSPPTLPQPVASPPSSPAVDPPVGWETLFEDDASAGAERIVRNERLDVLAEISGLLGDQLVTQALNSTIADILEGHLQSRMESAPSVFTREAREESRRTLNNLPRRPRGRNDFSDMGIVDGAPDYPPRIHRRNGTQVQAAIPVPRSSAAQRRSTQGEDDRLGQLELMMVSMQSLLSRQSQSQTHLEDAVQQIILNQTLLSTNATGISISVQPETAGRCVVCLDDSKPVDSAFYKCGHVITCGPCASILLAANPYCPLCRQKIEDVIKLYKLT